MDRRIAPTLDRRGSTLIEGYGGERNTGTRDLDPAKAILRRDISLRDISPTFSSRKGTTDNSGDKLPPVASTSHLGLFP
jgi:hypothetical protein